MAVDGYIRTAITELHSAVNTLQQEAHELQRQAEQEKGSMQKEIEGMQTQRKLHEAEITNMQDDQQRHAIQQRIVALNHKIDHNHARISRLDADISNAAQAKMSASEGILNIARQLDSLMASPVIRS